MSKRKKPDYLKFSTRKEVLEYLANGGKICFKCSDSDEYLHFNKRKELVNHLDSEDELEEFLSELDASLVRGIYSWPREFNYYRLARENGLGKKERKL